MITNARRRAVGRRRIWWGTCLLLLGTGVLLVTALLGSPPQDDFAAPGAPAPTRTASPGEPTLTTGPGDQPSPDSAPPSGRTTPPHDRVDVAGGESVAVPIIGAISGLITALAGLVTALVGLYTVTRARRDLAPVVATDTAAAKSAT